jgi:hypothetical protein
VRLSEIITSGVVTAGAEAGERALLQFYFHERG